jgi:hypothetical protein
MYNTFLHTSSRKRWKDGEYAPTLQISGLDMVKLIAHSVG